MKKSLITFNIIEDPEMNKVDISNKKMRAELHRIINILKISEEQKDLFIELGICDLTGFEFVYSEN